jgi:hypothetical protein
MDPQTSVPVQVRPEWPALPPAKANVDPGLIRILYKAQVRETARSRARDCRQLEGLAAEDAQYGAQAWEAEILARKQDDELARTEHRVYVEVAMASIDRARAGAEFVRNAAAAIGTIYTGVLGVVFAVGSNGTRAPSVAAIPAFFLGLSLVCATAYVAFIRPAKKSASVQEEREDDLSDLANLQRTRLNELIAWTSEIAARNKRALHVAVYALGAGVTSLPVPFLLPDGWALWGAAAVVLLAIVAAAFVAGPPRRKLGNFSLGATR